MRIATNVSIVVDLQKVYALCNPINKSACKKEISFLVKTRLRLRATDENGGWTYPSEEDIAGSLIDLGLATEIDV